MRRLSLLVIAACTSLCASACSSEPDAREGEALDGRVAPDADAEPDAGADAAALTDSEVAPSDAEVPADAGQPAPFVCDVQAPTSCPAPAPTYADVQPIFAQRCAPCHASAWTGPWPLDSYGHIADWQEEIRALLVSCQMPPPDGGVPLPHAERMQLLQWIRCDLPR